jgi:hypothetical protein
MLVINNFMTQHKFPIDLQLRVANYIKYTQSDNMDMDSQEELVGIIEKLPEALKLEIS